MGQPDCARWSMWVGKEIEGTEAIGQETLFVRHVPLGNFQNRVPEGIKRIWFCKEYTDWGAIRWALDNKYDVCLEVTEETYDRVPRHILRDARVYFKLDVPLKAGDFVCVGKPFHDEAFKIGTGVKVNPAMYAQDRKIC